MSHLIFPTVRNPQYIVSDNKNVLGFYIQHFLYFRNARLQLSLNLIKSLLPQPLLCLLLKTFVKKEDRLRREFYVPVNDLIAFIKSNTGLFCSRIDNTSSIYFIIRLSKWQRIDDKYIVIFFTENTSRPFAVAKISRLDNKENIEKEFENSRTVYDTLKKNHTAFVPEPVALHISETIIASFEQIIDGIPFNDYLKTISNKNRKKEMYFDILERCSDLQMTLHGSSQRLNAEDLSRFFYAPIEYFNKTRLSKDQKLKLQELKVHIGDLQKKGLPGVWMHGDFWLGSILFNSEKIGVIDWEFFTKRGVPLWDFFSLVFHIGTEFNYFADPDVSERIDGHLLELAAKCSIGRGEIQLLFQSYLMFNIQHRDSENEKYWQNFLATYWENIQSGGDRTGRLL